MKKLLQDPELNIWPGEVKGDTTSAKCEICKTVFKLSTLGKSALKDHSDGKKDLSEVKKMKTFFLPVNEAANKISSPVSSQSALQNLDSFVYTCQTMVTEIIWALKIVSSGEYC